MSVHLVNPSDNSFGTAVITPRWLFVLAAATPRRRAIPSSSMSRSSRFDPERIQAGDIVGISVHTGNALRGYEVGSMARERGAWVVYGGIHATLFPEEALERGQAHAVVKGDGDLVWAKSSTDCLAGNPERIYDGGRIEGTEFLAARWDLMHPEKYMWASVQTIRGCPKHCSFCSVWRTDGQKPRQRHYQSVIDEIVDLRRLGFRFIALADDNFYPVTLTDLRLAREQNNHAKLEELTAIRDERFQLMEELAKLPKDMVFFTQITMEAGEDGDYLDAMRKANIKGALVGVEAVTPEGLKAVFKDWNYSGEAPREAAADLQRARRPRPRLLHLRPAHRQARDLRRHRGDGPESRRHLRPVRHDDAVSRHRRLRPLGESSRPSIPPWSAASPSPATGSSPPKSAPRCSPRIPTMSSDEIRERTQKVWDRFYNWSAIWQRSACTPNLTSRIAFMNFGVFSPSLPQVIFSLGTAPE